MSSDEFDIVDDDADQTLALDEDVEDFDDAPGDEDEIFEDEDDLEPIRPPRYKPDSNVYSVFLILSFIAYAVALGFILHEMYDYSDPSKFLWGLYSK